MTTHKHTAGPWSIIQDAPLNPKARFQIGARLPNGFANYICTISTQKHLIQDGRAFENARLIAAAPALLAALEAALCAKTDDWQNGSGWEKKARSAIALATGSGVVK